MKQVLIDMNRLKMTAFNGLYQFSSFLGQNIAKLPQDEFEWNFYLPVNSTGIFGDHVKYVPHYSVDKYYMANTKRFDVWHITNQISWYRPFNNKTKVVFTIHDLNFLIEEKNNLKRNKRLLKEMQQRINRSHHITAISAFAKQQALEHLDIGDRPFTVIHNGTSVNEYPGYDDSAYRPENPFIFSIGTFHRRKNFHVLPSLLVNNNYELIIAGPKNGEYVNEVWAAAKKSGVIDRVKLIGPITEQDKYWYYKNCLAFSFPSFAEGFGLPVIEAMHFGKPVFLSKETCLPEIGGPQAYYFEDFDPDAMRDVFIQGMHHYETENPQQEIIERAAMFNWNNAAKSYVAIYKEVLGCNH